MKPDTKDFYCIAGLGRVTESRMGGNYAQVDLINMRTLEPHTTYLFQSMMNLEQWEPVMLLELRDLTGILTNLKIKTKKKQPLTTRHGVPILNADGVQIHMEATRAEIDKWLRDKGLL
jgi:hypothetical protein